MVLWQLYSYIHNMLKLIEILITIMLFAYIIYFKKLIGVFAFSAKNPLCKYAIFIYNKYQKTYIDYRIYKQ